MKKRSRKGRPRGPTKGPPSPLAMGKIPAALLEHCLRDAVIQDPTVIEGPRLGNDAAIIRPPQADDIVVTSDPISFTDIGVGEHLLAININDVVTTGAYPRWLVLTLMLPNGTRENEVRSFFASLGEACADHEIALVGGHTEVTDAVTRPLAVGTLIGVLRSDRRVDPSRSRPGDAVLLIGPIAVEGTALIARELAAEVERDLGKPFRDRAEKLLETPGICVREPALLAVSRYLAHALHDPTEGGLATALRELSALTAWGLDVDQEKVDILPETHAICEHFGISPYGLLASGSLLAVLPTDEAERLARALGKHLGIRAGIIGHLTEGKNCLWGRGEAPRTPIPEFPQDEIVRVLERRATE